MNHAITVGELLRVAGGIVGFLAVLTGGLIFTAAAQSDAPQAGDKAGREGCFVAMLGLVAIAAMFLSGCATPTVTKVQTIVVKEPVATQPIKPSDIPPLPGQLGPRPSDARDGEAVALAGRCDAIAFVIRAYPLLLVSAGLPPSQAPVYPECARH